MPTQWLETHCAAMALGLVSVSQPSKSLEYLGCELPSNTCFGLDIGSKLNQGWIVIRKIRKPQVGSHEIQLFWLHLRT